MSLANTRHAAPGLLALTLAALVAACGAPEHQPATRRTDESTAAEARQPAEQPAARGDERGAAAGAPAVEPVRGSARSLDFSDPDWSDRAAEITSRRVAIIVAADSYRQSSWNLPTVDDTGRSLRDELVESMQYAADDVVLLSGRDVSAESVQIELEELGERLTGDGNSLLVWWIGHGFNIQGQQRYLTYGSDDSDNGGYSRTLAHDDLRSWIGDTRRQVESRGGTLVTALVADACRTDTMSAPTRLREYRPELDIEAFSAPPGQPAEAGSSSGVTAYTGESIRTMRSLRSRERVSLVQILEQAGRSLDRSAEQAAFLHRATDKDVLLRNTTNLGLVVRVVDAHSGLPIEGATISRKFGETVQGAEARFTGLSETVTGYEFNLSAPGYFTRHPVVPLDAEDSGKTVTYELYREFVALRGRVSLLGAGAAVIEVTGSFDDPIEDWHEVRTSLDRSGDWELRVPHTAGPRSLRITDGAGTEIDTEDFDLGNDTLGNDQYGRVTVKTRDFGETAIAGGAGAVSLVDITASSLDLGDYALPWDSGTLTEQDFTSRRYYSFYRRVDGYVQKRDFATAAEQLDTLLRENRFKTQAARRDLEDKRHALEVAHLDQISKDQDRERAIETILASELREEEWILARLIEQLAASASDHYEARDFGLAVERLAMARDLGDRRWSRDVLFDDQIRRLEEVVESIPGRIQQVTAEWRNVASELGRVHGEWNSARQLLAAMRRYGADAESLRSWATEIEQEDISAAARRNWSLALDLKRADRLEEALATVRAVLDDPTCNAHYGRKAEAERAELWDRLYARAAQQGYELELQGRYEEAFEPYLAAYEIDSIEQTTLDRLLRDNPELPQRRPELIARMRRVRAGHDGEALRDEARDAYGAGRFKQACTLLRRAAAAYGEAEWRSAQAVVMRLRADILEQDLNDVDGSVSAWAELAEMWGRAGEHAERGEAIYNRAWLLVDSDVAAAQHGFEQAAASFGRAGDDAGQGKALMQLGWSHLPALGGSDYAAAREALARAEPLLVAAGDNRRLGQCLHGRLLADTLGGPTKSATVSDAQTLRRAIEAYRLGGEANRASALEREYADVLALLGA